MRIYSDAVGRAVVTAPALVASTVSLHDSILNVLETRLRSNRRSFLATTQLATARYEGHEKCGLGSLA